MYKREPKIWNGFVSREFILHLIKKKAIEEAKKQKTYKYARTGRIWDAR